MPTYFFTVRKDSHTPDTTGTELATIDEARVQAVDCIAREMRDHPRDLWNDEQWHIEVADDRGLILFTIYSAAITAPAGITGSVIDR